MYPELAGECASRQKQASYVDVIPVSIRIDYINPRGKISYKQRLISGGIYTEWYARQLIDEIESEHNLPLRKKDSNEDS